MFLPDALNFFPLKTIEERGKRKKNQPNQRKDQYLTRRLSTFPETMRRLPTNFLIFAHGKSAWRIYSKKKKIWKRQKKNKSSPNGRQRLIPYRLLDFASNRVNQIRVMFLDVCHQGSQTAFVLIPLEIEKQNEWSSHIQHMQQLEGWMQMEGPEFDGNEFYLKLFHTQITFT